MRKLNHGYTPSDSKNRPNRNLKPSNQTTTESRHRQHEQANTRVGKPIQADLHGAILHPTSLKPQNNHTSSMVIQTHQATRNTIAMEPSSRPARNGNPHRSYNQKEANSPKRPLVVYRAYHQSPTNQVRQHPIQTMRLRYSKHPLLLRSVRANLFIRIIHHGKP